MKPMVKQQLGTCPKNAFKCLELQARRRYTAAMSTHSIAALLATRGAWLKGQASDASGLDERKQLTRMIADNYAVFEQVRDRIFRSTEQFLRHAVVIPETLEPAGHDILAALLDHGLVRREEHGAEICEVHGKRYLSGGWLEELARLAAHEAGADEVIHGQGIGWTVNGYSGENEIDLIARRGDILSFVSCKALRSRLDGNDRKHRNRLMDAVHEADNLADHFGRPGERVAVLVTTDLFDELRGVPRYGALMGKAAVLDVRIISLEDLHWSGLVEAFAALWETK